MELSPCLPSISPARISREQKSFSVRSCAIPGLLPFSTTSRDIRRNRLSPELVLSIAREINSLRGMKDSEPDLRSATLIKEANPTLQVYSGNDDSVIAIHSAGLDGVVTGMGSAFPELFRSLSNAVASANIGKATAVENRVKRWKQVCESGDLDTIAAVKISISVRIPNYPVAVRPPLIPATRSLEAGTRETVAALIREQMT
jgi:dihydrodipicolinate synthase/N-acetylneuraminate lyase